MPVLLGAVVMLGDLLIDPAIEDRVVVQRLGFEQREDFVEQLANGEIHRFRQAGPLLQLGEIQHFVEDGQQTLAGLVQRIQALAVLRFETGTTQ